MEMFTKDIFSKFYPEVSIKFMECSADLVLSDKFTVHHKSLVIPKIKFVDISKKLIQLGLAKDIDFEFRKSPNGEKTYYLTEYSFNACNVAFAEIQLLDRDQVGDIKRLICLFCQIFDSIA